jgi:hypothetical protein
LSGRIERKRAAGKIQILMRSPLRTLQRTPPIPGLQDVWHGSIFCHIDSTLPIFLTAIRQFSWCLVFRDYATVLLRLPEISNDLRGRPPLVSPLKSCMGREVPVQLSRLLDFGRISNDKSAYRKSPSQAVMRDRKQIVNAKSNIVLQGLAVLSLLRNPSGGCERKTHRECSSRDGCNQPHP